MRRPILALAAILALTLVPGAAPAVEGTPEPPETEWSFDGFFGTFDRGAVQRGFQVYQEVCAACHALSLVAYRDLQAIGFTEDQVKAIAEAATVTDGPNEQGEMFERPGRPSDRFKAPFPNDQAARAANNGALPPDLSLMAKARPGGPDYIHALLIGYEEPPPGFQLQEGMNYNIYFPGHQIAMPPPLSEGQVAYEDGTQATVPQMAHDVATFLMWAAEPKLEARKSTGVSAIIFLVALTLLLYASKRKIWAGVH